MKSRNNLKLKEIKEKCKKLIEEEAKKQDVELNIEPITIVEYYDSDVFKEKTTIEKNMTKLVLANVGGLFDTETQKIIIFTELSQSLKHGKDILQKQQYKQGIS